MSGLAPIVAERIERLVGRARTDHRRRRRGGAIGAARPRRAPRGRARRRRLAVNEWAKKAVLLYFRVRGLDDDRGRAVRVPRPAAAEARLRGRGRPRRPAGDRALRRAPLAGRRADAELREHRRLGRRPARWSTRGRRWGRARRSGPTSTSSGGVGIGGVLEPVQAEPGDRRGRRVRRVAVHRRRGRAGRARGGARAPASSSREHAGDRRDRRRAGGAPRARSPPARSSCPAPARARSRPGATGCPAGLIIGYRSEATDDKVQLNELLREFGSSVGSRRMPERQRTRRSGRPPTGPIGRSSSRRSRRRGSSVQHERAVLVGVGPGIVRRGPRRARGARGFGRRRDRSAGSSRAAGSPTPAPSIGKGKVEELHHAAAHARRRTR